jgi:competence protein ComEC
VSRVLPAHLLAASCAVGLALADAARLPVAAALLFAAVAAAALVAARPEVRVLALAALVLVGGWAWGSARLGELDRSVLTGRIGTAGDGVAVTTAEARAGTFAQRQFARLRSFDGERVDERVELELPLGRAPPQGAVVRLLAVVKAPAGPSNGFDERTWLRRQGVHVVLQVDRWRVVGRRGGLGGLADRLRVWLRRASSPGLAGERRAVLEGVLLGDDGGLSDNLKQSFRRAGVYHLLAVSGENVVLLATGVLGLATLAGARRAWGHVGVLAAIATYVLAVGPQPSVIRAAVAGAAVSVAWLLGRLRDAWHVLLLAAIVLLAWNPYTVYDAGFQLSFAAVLAIFVLGGPAMQFLEGYPVPKRLRQVVAISAVCTVATAPLLWLQFGRVPVYGIAANALVEPAVAPLLALAFGAAAIDPLFPSVAHLLAWANGWVAVYIALCARLVGGLPGAQVAGGPAAVVSALTVVAGTGAFVFHRTSRSL